jgi:cobalt-zinc-cadmium resistance protein CzcA
MTGVKSDVAVKIFGEDLDKLFDLATQGAGIIRKIQGAGDVRVEQIVGLPQLVVRFDRDKIARYGLNINDVNKVVRSAFAGQSTGLVLEGEKRFDLVIRLEEEYRQNIEALMNLRVNRPDDELILLNQVADVEMISGPMQISREQTQRRVTIGINVRNRDVESFIGEVNTVLGKKLSLPPGYFITYGGQFENLKSAKETSAIAVPVSLAAIFVLLFFAFGSFRQSVMIFTAIPLAAVGGIWALLLRGMPFSISAGVGFIALFGIAVLNGIVLISHYNQLEKEGISDILERIRVGTSDRLRPVVMTSLVAALGFMPMAVSGAAGAEVQKPLASVVIGGILTSSFLTLVVLPVLYLIFNDGMVCFIQNRLRSRKRQVASPPLLLLILVISMMSLINPVMAQKPGNYLTMDSAVSKALRNNPKVKNFDLGKAASRKLIKTGVDLPSPMVSVEDGMINGDVRDYKITLSQDFAFPWVYVKQVQVYKKEVQLAGTEREINQAIFIETVKQAYMKWRIEGARLAILEKQDSMYSRFLAASIKRFESGDVGKLTRLLSESKAWQISSLLKTARIDLEVAEKSLRMTLCTTESFELPPGLPEKLNPPFRNPPDPGMIQPLRYLEQKTELENERVRKEGWSAAPGFSVGWFTQSIDQLGSYQGWQYGLTLPIWFWVPAGRIQAAKIARTMARNEYEWAKTQYGTGLELLMKSLEKQQIVMKYYEKTGLDHADAMIETAEKCYQSGETGYFEYLVSMGEAFDLRLGFLRELELYNKIVLDMTNLIAD